MDGGGVPMNRPCEDGRRLDPRIHGIETRATTPGLRADNADTLDDGGVRVRIRLRFRVQVLHGSEKWISTRKGYYRHPRSSDSGTLSTWRARTTRYRKGRTNGIRCSTACLRAIGGRS